MKKALLLLSLISAPVWAVSVDLNLSGGVSAIQDETVDDLTVNGNTILGNASGDSVTQNGATLTYAVDTAVTLTGGVNGINFDANTFSIDAANNRIGIGTAAPTAALHVFGNVILASNSVVDAYSDSFGAVTAGSTSTVTWTEVTDRLAEFTTSSFTATTAGYYEVNAHAGVSQTAGSACLILKVNGASPAGASSCNQGVTGLASVLDTSLVRILNLSANDIVRIDASATTANATFQKMFLTLKRIP